MSRNSRRTKTVSPVQTPNPTLTPPPQSKTNNPFGIDLVAATEVVNLPSEGKFYPPESGLQGKKTLEIRHLTAREEDILSNEQFIVDGSVFDRLLKSIIVDTGVDPSHLTVGDRDALLYAARITGYGSDYTMSMQCPACGKKTEFVFDLSKQQVEHDLPNGVVFDESNNCFTFQTPKTDLQVSVRVLTGKDLEYLEQQNDRAEKLGVENNKTVNLFRMAILSVNGVTDPTQLTQLYQVLPAIDSRKIRTVINNIAPTLSTKQSVACGSCGEETESEVPFSLGFFWPDL
tara:strand:- start:3073 stop:3936 length:864 start_codon:yes stop_codon:yes gene_type:complete